VSSSHSTDKLATELSILEAGFLPLAIFNQIARLTVTPCLELVCFRMTEDKIVQALLTRRNANDPHWPNQLHNPGTVIRATDVDVNGTFNRAINRIVKNELGNVEFQTAPRLVTHIFHQVKRGVEIAFIHWAIISSASDYGEFYDVTSLPNDLIDHHRKVIATALIGYSAESSRPSL